uniref:Uncharacterized protein n=1 Tax=Romanomermis culicivorax TaxID=13658 RepID=A0A915K5E1_ROMCU
MVSYFSDDKIYRPVPSGVVMVTHLKELDVDSRHLSLEFVRITSSSIFSLKFATNSQSKGSSTVIWSCFITTEYRVMDFGQWFVDALGQSLATPGVQFKAYQSTTAMFFVPGAPSLGMEDFERRDFKSI